MASDLFQECIISLGNNALILSEKESVRIFDVFEQEVPIYCGGSRIDWDKIAIKTTLNRSDQIISTLNQWNLPSMIDETVYVLWNDASIPVIQSNIAAIITHIEDVIAVGFETWLYNPFDKYIVEFYYLGDITIGLLPTKSSSI